MASMQDTASGLAPSESNSSLGSGSTQHHVPRALYSEATPMEKAGSHASRNSGASRSSKASRGSGVSRKSRKSIFSRTSSANRVAKAERRGLLSSWTVLPEYYDAKQYSTRRKYCIVLIVAFAAVTGPMGSSIMLPAIDDLAADLHTSVSTVNVSVGIYLVALGVFPLWWSNFSERHGRRSVYVISFIWFLAFSIGCAVAPSISSLIVLRLLSGVGASAVQAVGAGTISDMFVQEKRGAALGVFYLGPLLGPFISPILGGAVAEAWGWRASMWILVILCAINVFTILFFLPETLSRETLTLVRRRMEDEIDDYSLGPESSSLRDDDLERGDGAEVSREKRENEGALPPQSKGSGSDQEKHREIDQGTVQGTDQEKGQGTDQEKGQGTDQEIDRETDHEIDQEKDQKDQNTDQLDRPPQDRKQTSKTDPLQTKETPEIPARAPSDAASLPSSPSSSMASASQTSVHAVHPISTPRPRARRRRSSGADLSVRLSRLNSASSRVVDAEMPIDPLFPTLSRYTTTNSVPQRVSAAHMAMSQETPADESVHARSTGAFLYDYIVRPTHSVVFLTYPPVLLTISYSALVFMGIYFFNISISNRYSQPPYGFSPVIVGLMYIPNSVTYILASVYGGRWIDHLARKSASLNDGVITPESRISWNVVVSVCLFLPGCMIFGWCMDQGEHWVTPLIGTAIYGFASMILIGCNVTYIIDLLPGKGATGIALNNLVRQCLAATATFITEPLTTALGVGVLFSIYSGIITVAAVLVLYLKHRGPYLRDKYDIAEYYAKL